MAMPLRPSTALTTGVFPSLGSSPCQLRPDKNDAAKRKDQDYILHYDSCQFQATKLKNYYSKYSSMRPQTLYLLCLCWPQ